MHKQIVVSFVISEFKLPAAFQKAPLKPSERDDFIENGRAHCTWTYNDPSDYDVKIIATTLTALLRDLGARHLNTYDFNEVYVPDFQKQRHMDAMTPVLNVLRAWTHAQPSFDGLMV